MSVILSCQSISKAFSTRTLFRNLSFGVFDGDRTGIIGPNGAGKSTLMKIMAGLESTDEGNISLRKHSRVGYIPQVTVLDPEKSVREIVSEAISGEDDITRRVETVLSKTGFENPEIKSAVLSGGWKKRVSIASAYHAILNRNPI